MVLDPQRWLELRRFRALREAGATVSEIARETGLGRESLYKALSSDGNPEFGTVQKVVRSLGLKLHISA
jgi:probable addiction module antidote protein